VRMCTCMLANLPFFAPDVGVGVVASDVGVGVVASDVGVGVVVGIGVVGTESVDGGAHIIIHWYSHYSVCFRIKIQVREVYEHTWKFYY